METTDYYESQINLTIQNILRSMTVDFRHGSSKFRHKTSSMTKFQNVMYLVSQIKRRDELTFSS
jgi:hypothetical protein